MTPDSLHRTAEPTEFQGISEIIEYASLQAYARLEVKMENMKKYSFLMHPEMIEEIEKALPFSYDDNKSSFVRSAVNFYIGYLMHKQSVDYVAPLISNEIKNQVESLQDCLSEMIFKLAVESAKQNCLLSTQYRINNEFDERLDYLCAQKVASMNGIIDFNSIISDNDLAKECYG